MTTPSQPGIMREAGSPPKRATRLLQLIAGSRRRYRVPRSTIALLAISITLPSVLFTLAAAENWRDVRRGAEHHVERTTRILHEHALKIFETQQLILDQINERQREVDWGKPADVARLQDLLGHLRSVLPQVVDIILTDEDGRILIDSLRRRVTPTVSIADRDYFQALKAKAARLPFISQPAIGKLSGLPVFNIAMRRAGGTGGAFNGVISIALDQAYFSDLYRDLEPGFTQNVVLARDDGKILASDPPMAETTLPAVATMPTALTMPPVSDIIRPMIVNGSKRIFGYERVGDYPVVIGFGVTLRSAMAPWWRNMFGYGLVAGLSSLLLLGVSAFAIRRIRLEGRATRSWRQTAAELETEIAERGRLEAQLRQSQKMEAVGQLTGGIAHDFNNLLTVVIGNLDLLSRRMPNAEPNQRSMVRNAIEAAQRAAGLTSRLLSFSRQQPLDAKPIDANALIHGMTTLLGRTLGEAVAIELQLCDELWTTLADPNQLENAILNLCVNGVDAMPKGGQLTLSTENVALDRAFCAEADHLEPGRYVAIAVTDTGTGMSADVVQHAFEPFFTTKPVGKGTGLGLSQIYGFARQSNGHAQITSQPGQGTKVTIFLPRTDGSATLVERPVATEVTGPTAALRGRRVLIVEDDDLVRSFSGGALRESGFKVIEAATGADGLRELERHPDIDLLFTDVVLKGPMNGRELADRAAALRPGLPILFTTGYTKDAIVHDGRLDDGVNLLGKPFTTAELTSRIGTMLAQAAALSTAETSAVA